jgi:prolyl 4-hydroxylase
MKLHKVADNIFTVEDFLTRQECLENIVHSEKIGYELAKVNTAGGSKVKTFAIITGHFITVRN